MIRITLDAGHGGSDPGATFHAVREKNICLAIVKFLEHRLAPQHRVHLTRWSDFTVSIVERCQLANAAHSDIFLSIHCNADPDPDEPGMREASGAEIWIYPGSVAAKSLAEKIGAQFVKRFPDEPWRGVKEGNLGVLRLTKMPAVLIEVGFIDHSETLRRLRNPEVQYQIAVAIAAGVEEYSASIKTGAVG